MQGRTLCGTGAEVGHLTFPANPVVLDADIEDGIKRRLSIHEPAIVDDQIVVMRFL